MKPIDHNDHARSKRRQEHVRLPSGLRAAGANFFAGSTVEVARRLVGAYLVRRLPGARTAGDAIAAGRIVETEAYLPFVDPACHGYRGPTKRNAIMFDRPGRAYVYFIYGNHYCLNVTTEPPGIGAAVLIRALEPTHGLDAMRRRRAAGTLDAALACGPGNLCRALAVDRACNAADLARGDLVIACGSAKRRAALCAGPRIGLNVASSWPLRFFDPRSPSISPFRRSRACRKE